MLHSYFFFLMSAGILCLPSLLPCYTVLLMLHVISGLSSSSRHRDYDFVARFFVVPARLSLSAVLVPRS